MSLETELEILETYRRKACLISSTLDFDDGRSPAPPCTATRNMDKVLATPRFSLGPSVSSVPTGISQERF